MKAKIRKPKAETPGMREIKRIMLKSGRYYQSGEFFYHRLLRQHFQNIGFRVMLVEKIIHHPVWHIRLRCTGRAQNHLLIIRPMPKRRRKPDADLLLPQLRDEVKELLANLGPPVKNDDITVGRVGAYFDVSFVWPMGKTGLFLRKAKKPEAFQFLIRPWLRKQRN